jgi:hypothetical protein
MKPIDLKRIFILKFNNITRVFYRKSLVISHDSVAIVGKKNYLFLYEGFNRYYQMYFDRQSVVYDAINSWSTHLNSWIQTVSLKSGEFHFICVPNKASLHHRLYPLRLGSKETPYLSILQKRTMVNVFKTKKFEEVFRRNDTHLSPYGNFKFADFILKSLGYRYDFGDLVSTGFQEVIGDLGSKFDPPISERVEFLKNSNSSTTPRVLLDNSSEYLPDRHIGIAIQFQNKNAPFENSLRIFGNSFLGNSSDYSTLWLLSLVFQRVSFHWSPVVLPETIEEGEIVIFQTCERFLGYSPDHWK